MLRYAYVTNGLADHRLDDALSLLAESGYTGVAITLDHHHLDPFAADLARRVSHIAERLRELRLAVVIETGARFVLDGRRKHEPTMLSDEGRERRINFLRRAIVIAADLGAEAVSLWSGRVSPDVPDDVAWHRLIDGCEQVLAAAHEQQMPLGFEPDPGMFVEYLEQWQRLANAVDDDLFGLTLDLGHCHYLEQASVAECIERFAPRMRHVHIEDMTSNAHDHLNFGDGTLDFPPAIAALQRVQYGGLVAVELPRHSHAAHTVVPRAIEFLKQCEGVT